MQCGNMNAVGKILRLDNIDVISILRRIPHTYSHSHDMLLEPSYVCECVCSVDWVGILQFSYIQSEPLAILSTFEVYFFCILAFDWTLSDSYLSVLRYFSTTISTNCEVFFYYKHLIGSIVGSLVGTLSEKFGHVENFVAIVWIFWNAYASAQW